MENRNKAKWNRYLAPSFPVALEQFMYYKNIKERTYDNMMKKIREIENGNQSKKPQEESHKSKVFQN